MQTPVPGVNGVEGGRARTRLTRLRTCTGVHKRATGVLPAPVPPPACTPLLHARARAPAEDGTCPRVGVGVCLPLLGTRTYTGHGHAARAALQSHMSHPQGTQGSPRDVALATATSQALAPHRTVSRGAGSRIVPAASSVSARRPSHGARQHRTRARGRGTACIPPGSGHGGRREHPPVCTLVQGPLHARLHARAADTWTHASTSAGRPRLPATFPLATASPHAPAHPQAPPPAHTHTHAGAHRLVQARVLILAHAAVHTHTHA